MIILIMKQLFIINKTAPESVWSQKILFLNWLKEGECVGKHKTVLLLERLFSSDV
jgi:hypothetical protein